MKKVRGQGITHVSSLFTKYKTLLKAPQNTITQVFIKVIKHMFGTALTKEHCSYSPKTHTLSVKTSGVIKSEILLKKQEILAEMQNILGEKDTPKEIV